MIFINQIEIQKLRSIMRGVIKAKGINVIVGRNDAGKSNVLKSLDLFFNYETNYLGNFEFDQWYSKFAIERPHRAKEFSIQLIISPPPSFRSGNVIWKKIWRKEGLNREIVKNEDGTEFKSRSRIHTFLKRINYQYVPAIKDLSFFQELLKNLHDSLPFDLDEALINKADAFIGEIRSQTKLVSESLEERLSIGSKIQIPPSFRDLFALFDFETEHKEQHIPLSFRGDGIKIRHIPIIMKFIANSLISNKPKGEISSHTIWGFEEPENNVELNYAFDMAKEFLEYSNDTNLQIFLTTHSPAFYSLTEDARATAYYAYQDDESEGTNFEIVDKENIDERMGLLPFVTPYISQEVQKRSELESKYSRMNARFVEPAIFVEGLTDKAYIDKAISLYEYEINAKVHSRNSAGANWVKERLLERAYIDGDYKGVGIFDNDEGGRAAKNGVESDDKYRRRNHNRILKVLLLPKPPHIIEFLSCGIELDWGIEDLFPLSYWEEADVNGWLTNEKKIFINVLSHQKTALDFCLEKGINPRSLVYLKKFNNNSKINFKKSILRLGRSRQLDAFKYFRGILTELERFFS